MATFTELFEQLDPDDNVRASSSNASARGILQHDPVYAGQLTHVWLWKNWPGRWYPKKEAGIDLVAEHRDGHTVGDPMQGIRPGLHGHQKRYEQLPVESNRPGSRTVC